MVDSPTKRAPNRVIGRPFKDGNPGGPGAPPKSFKFWCRDVIESPATQREIKAILADRRNKNFAGVLKIISSYGAGMPSQEVVHSGTIALEHIQSAQTAFQGRMARLTERLGAAAFPEFDGGNGTSGGAV